MDGDPWQPPIPPPVDLSDRQLVTRFAGHIHSHTSTVKGYDKITIAVPHSEIYKALLMMHEPLMLHFEVYGPQPVGEGEIDAGLAAILGLPTTEEGNMDWNTFDDDT